MGTQCSMEFINRASVSSIFENPESMEDPLWMRGISFYVLSTSRRGLLAYDTTAFESPDFEKFQNIDQRHAAVTRKSHLIASFRLRAIAGAKRVWLATLANVLNLECVYSASAL